MTDHDTADDWAATDSYLAELLVGDDPALTATLEANAAAGLPPIDVAPVQGKLLHLLARIRGARRILEIGTLGGYSTIWLARAVGDDGRVVTLEYEPRHAEVARANLDRAGVGERVDVRVGAALDLLPSLTDEAPFDLVFVDADKENNPHYVRWALRLGRPGTVIVVDNVIRGGSVTNADLDDERVRGAREVLELMRAEPRLDATALQTVGAKGWDGFALAVMTG
ncbi:MULTISPECIES: O-methyltransferase [Rhodococcus]|uniref:Methyltransferase n=2 Tax=Rhodococcus TaxID=1827 RepID=M2WU30_9NOCA|nr:MULTISPECIES: O-methyltransferase [Rhodococcus]EME52271.1 methyltransferase [Rhodococcus ruber BKS 20-38]MDM7489125.1 O-methyltransferase [Rhodococcus indonesiensis]